MWHKLMRFLFLLLSHSQKFVKTGLELNLTQYGTVEKWNEKIEVKTC